MIARFCAYAVLRNLRFFDAFLILFLLLELKISYLELGALLAYEKILGGVLEIPLGIFADKVGRRISLSAAFVILAVACVLFVAAAHVPQTLICLYVAQTFLGLSEALRSGTHKAMILDWLSGEGRSDEATQVMSLTRFFSKSTEGVAALLAGVIVFLTDAFSPLLWLTIAPALANAALIASYPKALEGDLRRAGAGKAKKKRKAPKGPLIERLKALRAHFGGGALVALIFMSVFFESQIKLSMRYLQPYLEQGLGALDLTAQAGAGALIFGAYHFIKGLLAGGSAFLANRLPRWLGGPQRALQGVYLWATAAMALTALGLWLGWAPLGFAMMLALAALQNARRPLFVATLDGYMDKRWRTTTLSVESQLRQWAYALTALGTGALAEWGGLPWAFALMAAIMIIGAAAGLALRQTQPREA